LQYLGDRSGQFYPSERRARSQVDQWLFWQCAGLGPMAGQAAHFNYQKEKIPYAIERYSNETRRLYGVLDKRLAQAEYMAGDYSIADMAIWPWYGNLVLGRSYPEADKFLDVGIYTNLKRWADAIEARPATKRGRIVNKVSGDPSEQMAERHSSADFAGRV
jgi:GST-like protein